MSTGKEPVLHGQLSGGLVDPAEDRFDCEQLIPLYEKTQGDEISQLYAEVARIAVAGADSDSVEDGVALQAQLQNHWSRLRQLQEAEAEELYRLFEASLEMPIDAGAQLLHQVRSLKIALEDSAASDAPSR